MSSALQTLYHATPVDMATKATVCVQSGLTGVEKVAGEKTQSDLRGLLRQSIASSMGTCCTLSPITC